MALVKWAVVLLAVACPIAAFFVALYLYKFIRHRPLAEPVPFPPVQPLAHRRDTLPLTHSRVSLLPVPSPHFYSPPLTAESTSSLGSDDQPSPRITPTPSPDPTAPATPPATTRRPRQRPLSVSSYNTVRSKSSRNTLRGTPHHPRSSIQIVLPAPLGSPSNLTERDRDDRSAGTADRWTRASHLTIHEHSDPHHDEPSHHQPRRILSNPSLASNRAIQSDARPPLPSPPPPSSFNAQQIV
ncbi:hypothetical protein D9619_003066 [Psilocybe cf. subviscida]|uniref:Uncharacterized protein n=1 Tax=Psilocybe cf. subviscida TaxID=2480587 RepID=A0A8H5AX82_9AGAR|nr:hypothetical protein D9619_003066 [Psilocybe cf. subviscida]